MSFSKYAALIKNLRGVVLANIEEPGVWNNIKWLTKRFRYRNLGLTPTLANIYRDKLTPYLNGNPFIELTPPINAVTTLVEILAKTIPVRLEVIELLVYASTYISPAIVVGTTYFEELGSLAIDVIYVCKDMDTSSWKLHLRIADYTILDFYKECVDEAIEVLISSNPKLRLELLTKVVEKRRDRISKDKKRYWRISCDRGKPFLLYIDMANLIIKYELLDYLEVEHAAGLTIVPVVVISHSLQ
ncbi:MAG: hypothetical protein QXL96_02840 [Ignisphaera sp.]